MDINFFLENENRKRENHGTIFGIASMALQEDLCIELEETLDQVIKFAIAYAKGLRRRNFPEQQHQWR